MVLDPTAPRLSEEDINRARALWSQYQRSHDLSQRRGETAGVDPVTERIWFGDSILDVARQRELIGESSPLHFFRVGYDSYYRKGRRR
jgi:hypothetical protein